MKWLVVFYSLFLFSFYVMLWQSKKKEKLKKILYAIFFVFQVFFFLLVGYYGHFLAKEKFLLEKEYENLGFLHDDVQNIVSLQSENASNLKETIASLETRYSSLEQKKQQVTQEIQKLQQQYQNLSNAIKNAEENVSYEEFRLPNFPTYDQRKYYPNGCESVSLHLLLKYNGVEVSPETIVNTLKKGDTPHMEGNVKYGGDPEIEFVGNPKDKSGYGVYENPIITVANQYKKGIKKITGSSLSRVLEIVESGHPVQVWASSYQRTPTKCNTWIHKESGKTITWYCNFHSLVVIGFSLNKVIVSDPLTGTIVKYDRNRFEQAYDFYGRRAIYYE